MVSRKLPTGIQDYSTIREGGFLYVDKTKYFYQLLTTNLYYFLSRPRRFGKSLTISTLEAIFQGRRELFQDTWIDNSDYDWKVHPVIRVDMSAMPIREGVGAFKLGLIKCLNEIAKAYGVTLPEPVISVGTSLGDLITLLQAAHGKVVVLIDEYDKPIVTIGVNFDTTERNVTEWILQTQTYSGLDKE